MTVQWNLFGGTVIKLGTERHRGLLNGVDDLSNIGCFALTELGYGNNAVEMETTAIYDEEKREFIINTPTPLAQKYWITNSAVHAKWAVVFAQTIIRGKNEGIHAILVRIREENMVPSKGVTIEDMGVKFECNGVDNGKLWFNDVRVPVENLLNRYSDIDDKNNFTSVIGSRRGRFLKVANQLLSGRLAIASLNLGGTKGDSPLETVHHIFVIELYGLKFYPFIHTIPQSMFVYRLSLCKFQVGSWAKWEKTEKDSNEVVRLCCVIKPLVTWNFERVATVCRERCGGQGYLSINRFGSFIGFSHAGMTAEGDNSVLMQKVSKELLADVQSGKVKLPQVPDAKNSQKWDVSDLNNQLKLLQLREQALIKELGTKMAKKSLDVSIFETWMLHESDTVQALAKAHGERIVLEQLIIATEKLKGGARKLLITIGQLYALCLIDTNLAWYIMNHLILVESAAKVQPLIREIVADLAPSSIQIVDSLGVDPRVLYAPIASDWSKFNEIDNQGELLKEMSVGISSRL
ncbi:13907_t:CDS:10 [Acaulospora colombiana]|uniref:13907_t:CDS:1 n=1 Tax=Acaulospora colombiana TaxID=27376 RepID=A0ACA9LFI1_9GLOM|nr:13907_t:CDS:10 [Acaulospora colombiana]